MQKQELGNAQRQVVTCLSILLLFLYGIQTTLSTVSKVVDIICVARKIKTVL
jgi:hypothetical protein